MVKGLNTKRIWFLIYRPLALGSSGWFESKTSLTVRELNHLLSPRLPQFWLALSMASPDPTQQPNQPFPPHLETIRPLCIFWVGRIFISSYFKNNWMKAAALNNSLLSCNAFYVWITKPCALHNSGLAAPREAAPLSLFYRQSWNRPRELQWEASCQAVSQWESWGRNYGNFFFNW